jgi:hypothetical protein
MSSPSTPVSVGGDPFGTLRGRFRQGQVKEVDRLPMVAADAVREDPRGCLVDVRYGHRDTQDRRLERYGQFLLENVEEPHELFFLIMTIDRGLFDHLAQFRFAQLLHERKRKRKGIYPE